MNHFNLLLTVYEYSIVVIVTPHTQTTTLSPEIASSKPKQQKVYIIYSILSGRIKGTI